jgi:hypothetical protein
MVSRQVLSSVCVQREITLSAHNNDNRGPIAELAALILVSHTPRCAPKATRKLETSEECPMNTKQIILAGAVMALSIGAAQAGPCDMTGKSASMHDAGAGPTPGNTGQTTTGTSTGASTNQHAANSTMNRAAGDVATSSQDAQKQMQGQPTAAQQADGAKSADRGC